MSRNFANCNHKTPTNMKNRLCKTAIAMLFIVLNGHGFAQSETEEKVVVYEFCSQMPMFPGGENAYFRYLAENLVYPLEARGSGIQGKVYVQFVVWTDGSIRDVEVVKGVHELLDNEAIRVVKMMPNWQPGEQLGKKVPVRYRLPIKFTID